MPAAPSLLLPPPFVRQMQQLLGTAYAAFADALHSEPPVSIRLHAHKNPPGSAFFSEKNPQPIPWHPLGRYLQERPVFTLDPSLHGGGYYVQEAASMFLREAISQTCDLHKPLRILDLCAAPGGKSTLLADMLPPGGLLVANEVIKTRVAPLRENLERWGNPQVALTSAEAEDFARMGGWFDVVVCDAPCSGEGLFRKDPDAVREWSPDHVALCSARQRRILTAAVEALTPGGVLVYSTCTYNRSENEDNALWLTRTFDLEPLPLAVPDAWGATCTEPGGWRFFPHRTRGEGFFLAVFRKKGGTTARTAASGQFVHLRSLPKPLLPEARRWWNAAADTRFFQTSAGDVLALPTALEEAFLYLDRHLKARWFGTNMGAFKGKDFIPAHALALSQQVAPDLPTWVLSREQALLFLKKETFEVPPDRKPGWVLARHAHLSLGWMKLLPNRMNNYLPQERRIRMATDAATLD